MARSYNEIFEWLYGKDSRSRKVADLPLTDRLPYQVIAFFCERKGFDWWWSNCEDEIQDEMFDELRTLLKEEANK